MIFRDPLLDSYTIYWALLGTEKAEVGYQRLVCAHCQRVIDSKVFYDIKYRPYDAFCWSLRYSIGLELPKKDRGSGSRGFEETETEGE